MKRVLSLLASVLVAGCATVASEVPPAAKAELAPTGALRAALLASNPMFVTQNTPPGVTKGLAVDIAKRLADRIGVPMKPVPYPSIGSLIDAGGKGEWDITFLPVNPERAKVMNFTAPYMYLERTLLVPAASTATQIGDLDRVGKTIVAVARSSEEAWLRGNLKAATQVTASTPAAALQMLKEGKVDAYANGTPALAEAATQVPGARVLPGSFSDGPVALAVIKVRPAADAFAYEFMEQLVASGAIREWIEREKLVGVRSAK